MVEIQGYIIFAAPNKYNKDLLHTTIKPTEKECKAWAYRKKLTHIELIKPLEEFLKSADIGNNDKEI